MTAADNKELIQSIEDHGIMAQGRTELINHLKGKRLTLKKAILAHCYECNGYFSDGRADCQQPTCTLYPFMIYNPAKISSRDLSEETLEKMKERSQATGFGRKKPSEIDVSEERVSKAMSESKRRF